ncbi:MAG TPA: tyrosine-type recombinase/integrase [Flavilitoribacter sp.]|nr:tyrosine-type recombinase/integrase [Flavilitoribacter sp.]HMQ89310.1 tyrosine-type recombinase/integrase [Flavilitoribacter sp.]
MRSSEVSERKKTGPKWSFVTTHTARRSAATNLYLQGVSLKMIAELGGWGDERRFL